MVVICVCSVVSADHWKQLHFLVYWLQHFERTPTWEYTNCQLLIFGHDEHLHLEWLVCERENSFNDWSMLIQVSSLTTRDLERYLKSKRARLATRSLGGIASAITETMYHCTSRCSHPVTCFSEEIPSLKCQNPVWGCSTANLKSNSGFPTAFMHHFTSWSQNCLCQWWRGSEVRKTDGSASGQSDQNGRCTPLRQYFVISFT